MPRMLRVSGWGADLLVERAHLSTKRRLRFVQLVLGRQRQASLLSGHDEIGRCPSSWPDTPCLRGMATNLQSLLPARREGLS